MGNDRRSRATWSEAENRWRINVQADGQRRTFYCSKPGPRGRTEAERKADAWLRDRLTGESTKCDVLLDRYLESVETTTSHANTRKVKAYIDSYIRPAIGHKKMSSVTEMDLQKIIDRAYKKAAADWVQGGLSKKSLQNLRATITAWVKFCRLSKVTTLRPEALSVPKGARPSAKTILPLEDLVTLFKSDETSYYKQPLIDWYIHAYRVAVLTGLRPGELLGLKWSDIKNGIITVRRSINDDDEITDGKNENARRSIAITPMIAAELEAQEQQLIEENVKSEWIFPDWSGGPSKQQTYRKEWYRYRQHNGLTDKITPYELRHTFVSVCDDMPIGLKKMVVGHSKSMDTEGVYGHRKAGDLERAGEYSEAAFRRILGGDESKDEAKS